MQDQGQTNSCKASRTLGCDVTCSEEAAKQGDLSTTKVGALNQKSPANRAVPVRWIFCALSSWAFFNVYAMRVNLSVALVAMVKKDYSHHISSSECTELLPTTSTGNFSVQASPTYQGEFDWDSHLQGLVLGAFFYGYVIPQIPGGILAQKYGAKWLFGIGILVTAIFTLLTPIAARWDVAALIVVRFIEGVGEGVTFPAMYVFISRWAPKNERSRIATIIFMGSTFGTVVSMSTAGVLSASSFLGGWPSVFYVFGAIGCIWFVFWAFFIYESPEDHPWITESELKYIQSGREQTNNRSGPVPWKSILTSGPVWALVTAHFGYNWGFYTLLTELPTYLSDVLHFELKKNGVLSAVPYLLQAIFALLASLLADRWRSRNTRSITFIRKVMNCIAFFIPGCILMTIIFAGCHSSLIVALLSLAVGVSGFMYSGFNITHVDMSPEYAGTLMGITNAIANLTGFLSPLYVGYLTGSLPQKKSWNITFLTSSGVYFLTGIIFVIFGSAELQPWGITARPPSDENINNKSSEKGTVNHATP